VSENSPDNSANTSTGNSPADSSNSASAASLAPGTKPGQGSRIVSLDVFRGMTIAGMILVNDPGTWAAVYWPLDHAEWNGWTPTDLIFPFFLFIVGVSMTLSFTARMRRGGTRGALARHVLIRSLSIVAVGLFFNVFPRFHFSTMRYAGVLQRIGVCYLIAGLFVVVTAKRADREGFVPNIAAIASALVALLVGYWALMRFVPVPGCGTGLLDQECSLAAWIDRRIMLGHLWRPRWDPEGFLSTLPAIGTVFSGVLVGEWLRSDRPVMRKLAWMACVGAAAMIVARYLLHPIFPINKNLWTSTYVVFTSGFAMVMLALCFWIVDVKGLRKWAAPFMVLGTNAITAFSIATFVAILSLRIHVMVGDKEVSLHGYAYSHWFATIAQPKNASLLYALCFVLVCFLPVWVLYWRRIFIKL
jgi:predicted acyltransferase